MITSSKESIWCTNDPKAHIRSFCKRWRFIWWYFFPVSILNLDSKFQLQQTILIFGTNLQKKVYFRSKEIKKKAFFGPNLPKKGSYF